MENIGQILSRIATERGWSDTTIVEVLVALLDKKISDGTFDTDEFETFLEYVIEEENQSGVLDV